ncbi:hypothetical protein [Blastopirellula retiformator]|uniref:hypothetical protein n=1 Tax=Blastopirellula retiformator TaxID=2527970 RepID=UPI001FE73794|nr:hypothetical protein [Blastopirellula retiformator]
MDEAQAGHGRLAGPKPQRVTAVFGLDAPDRAAAETAGRAERHKLQRTSANFGKPRKLTFRRKIPVVNCNNLFVFRLAKHGANEKIPLGDPIPLRGIMHNFCHEIAGKLFPKLPM